MRDYEGESWIRRSKRRRGKKEGKLTGMFCRASISLRNASLRALTASIDSIVSLFLASEWLGYHVVAFSTVWEEIRTKRRLQIFRQYVKVVVVLIQPLRICVCQIQVEKFLFSVPALLNES